MQILLDEISDLEQSEQDMIIRLPYRVGMWISLSDDTGGEDSREQEQQVLESIVTSYAQDFCKSEFVQRIMNYAVRCKKDWLAWEADLEQVPDECQRVIYLLGQNVDKREVESFKNILLEIATSVAMAYREFGEEEPAGRKLAGYVTSFARRARVFVFGGTVPAYDDMLNISSREEMAIKHLVHVLGMKDAVTSG